MLARSVSWLTDGIVSVVQISLLARTLLKQEVAAHALLEDKLKSSEDRVASLSAELTDVKKKLAEEIKARETAEKLQGTAETALANAQRNERHL